jgi:hypothetical protein
VQGDECPQLVLRPLGQCIGDAKRVAGQDSETSWITCALSSGEIIGLANSVWAEVNTMSEAQPEHSIVAGMDQPLIAIPTREDGREVVRYFADEAAAEAATSDEVVREALRLAGVWSDLDWDEMSAALDRIRHESKPTPPIELDV